MDIVIAIAVLGGLGLVFGLVLGAAAKVFHVEEDPRLEQLNEALPGANCGGCGFAGCSSYAKAIAEGAPVNLCPVGGQAVAERLAAIMGVEAGAATQHKAVVACQTTVLPNRYDYQGISSCKACNTLFNGKLACPYGCLGFGDCAAVCPTGAIALVDGHAHVDPDKCIGCGKCQEACPKKIIFLYSDDKKPIVMCANHLMAIDTRKQCQTGCIGCGKCQRGCPVQAITVRGNVARIDYDKCIACGKCITECPVHAILPPPQSTVVS